MSDGSCLCCVVHDICSRFTRGRANARAGDKPELAFGELTEDIEEIHGTSSEDDAKAVMYVELVSLPLSPSSAESVVLTVLYLCRQRQHL